MTVERPRVALARLAGFSAAGLLAFFLPVEWRGSTTIPLDHAVNALQRLAPTGMAWLAWTIVLAGGLLPFLRGTWRRSPFWTAFSALKLAAIVPATMAVIGSGPAILMAPDILPFLYEKLVIPVGLIVPIGALFLSFLVAYGLLEMVGVMLEPVMRPIWRTPGRSAIDAVASFVGSYSIGLLITNRVYRAGEYSAREAAIIATGFSTVSATFMVIVARTLDLMSIWHTFFWSTLGITFLVTAITVRLPPLSRMPDGDQSALDRLGATGRLRAAARRGLAQAEDSGNPATNLTKTFREGLEMVTGILPAILSIGLLGLLAARHTPLFDWLGWLFYPVTWLTGHADPLGVARASASGLAEMFLPALVATEMTDPDRFTVGVVSIAAVLFFSASIPCILSTSIPITVRQMLAIWFERLVLSLLFAGLTAKVVF